MRSARRGSRRGAAVRTRRPPPREPAADLQQARAVDARCRPRRRVASIAAHLSASIALDVSAFLTANVPPKPQHSSARRQLDELEAAHRAQQPQRRVADARHAQRVARRVVGDAVRERGADVLDAEPARRAAPTARRRAVADAGERRSPRAAGRARAPCRRTTTTARRRPRTRSKIVDEAPRERGAPRRGSRCSACIWPQQVCSAGNDDLVPEPLEHAARPPSAPRERSCRRCR